MIMLPVLVFSLVVRKYLVHGLTGGALLALASLWLVWSLGELGGQHLANHRLAARIERFARAHA